MIVDHTRIGAAFRRLSIPVAFQILGDQLLGTADTIAIGSLGAVALAGATAANTIFIAIVFSASGFMSGTSIVAAQSIGTGDVDGFARTVRAGVIVPLLIGAGAFGTSLFASAPAIHALVGALPSAHASAIYLVLRCASILPIVVSGTFIVGIRRRRKPAARNSRPRGRQPHSYPATADARSGLVDAPSVRDRRRRCLLVALRNDRRVLRDLIT